MDENKKTFKQWCAEHKKELIAAGIVAVGISGVLIFRHAKKGKIVKDTIGPALAMANDATFKSECGIGESDILFQNIVSRNISGFDTEKIIPVTKSVDDVLSAFGDYFEDLLDHIDIDEIENITVCYDIAKASV